MIFSVEMKRSTSVLGWFSPSGAWVSRNNHIRVRFRIEGIVGTIISDSDLIVGIVGTIISD